MAVKIKIQKRTTSQWVVTIPNSIAEAVGMGKSEEVKWEIESKRVLKLIRMEVSEDAKD
jgi:antitoxin component of MazEF toxin-antitoxin module